MEYIEDGEEDITELPQRDYLHMADQYAKNAQYSAI